MLTGGLSIPLCWRPEQETLASYPVNRPLEVVLDSVNTLFAILLQKYDEVVGNGRFLRV